MRTIFSFLLCCLTLSQASAIEELPQYEGKSIDLVTYPAAKLLKGAKKLVVADNLDVKGIYTRVSQEKNNWFLEVDFAISDQKALSQDTWLQLRSNVIAASVSINGQLLFENGQVGTSHTNESSGKSLFRQIIPKKLLKLGINSLQVSFSNFSYQGGAIFRDIALGPLSDFQQQSLIMSTAPLVLSGIFLFAMIANLGFYFALDKNAVFSSLVFLFVCCFSLMINEALYWNELMATVNLLDNTTLVSLIEYLIFASLILVMCLHFSLKRKHIAFCFFLYVALTIVCYLLVLPKAPFLSGLLIALCAFAQKIQSKDSAVMLSFSIFLTIVVFIDQFNILDNQQWVYNNFILTSFVFKVDYLAIALFSLLMIVFTARGILHNSLSLQKSRLQLDLLEFQFVQKHIQPHFLMNTLMSLQQLIKKDQALAGELIDALSEEFHLMTQMTQKIEVPIEQEIQMCRHYLKIMSLQHKTVYHFNLKGIAGDETIPPAIFHTIVENGLTHGFTGSQQAIFTLTKEETSEKCVYKLSNNGNKKSIANSKPTTGSGLKYIKSRLQQWHPLASKVFSYGDDQGWHTVIELQRS
ncbi:sensor histidine kinase [Aliikangiella sp. IMCC44653]